MEAHAASIALYVENADATYKRSLDAGAVSIRESQDQFYGDRSSPIPSRPGVDRLIAET
jgi:PhnB protein